MRYLPLLMIYWLLPMATPVQAQNNDVWGGQPSENQLPPPAVETPIIETMPRLKVAECEALGTNEEKARCAQSAFLQLVYSQIKYPKEAQEAGIMGMCMIAIDVEADGQISAIRAIKTPSPMLSDEVIRAIKEIDKSHDWMPATSQSKPVKASLNIPLRFKLTR